MANDCNHPVAASEHVKRENAPPRLGVHRIVRHWDRCNDGIFGIQCWDIRIRQVETQPIGCYLRNAEAARVRHSPFAGTLPRKRSKRLHRYQIVLVRTSVPIVAIHPPQGHGYQQTKSYYQNVVWQPKQLRPAVSQRRERKAMRPFVDPE